MLSITIDNLNNVFTTEDLKDQVNAVIETSWDVGVKDDLRCVDRGDEGIQFLLGGARGLLEISLDDAAVVHMYCSMSGELELLGLALCIVDHFRVEYAGSCDVDEMRYLKYLRHQVESGVVDWGQIDC